MIFINIIIDAIVNIAQFFSTALIVVFVDGSVGSASASRNWFDASPPSWALRRYVGTRHHIAIDKDYVIKIPAVGLTDMCIPHVHRSVKQYCFKRLPSVNRITTTAAAAHVK